MKRTLGPTYSHTDKSFRIQLSGDKRTLIFENINQLQKMASQQK